MDESTRRRVRERAAHVCEYCHMPQAYYPTVPFPIDHIVARQHGGRTTMANLAPSCLHDFWHDWPGVQTNTSPTWTCLRMCGTPTIGKRRPSPV